MCISVHVYVYLYLYLSLSLRPGQQTPTTVKLVAETSFRRLNLALVYAKYVCRCLSMTYD